MYGTSFRWVSAGVYREVQSSRVWVWNTGRSLGATGSNQSRLRKRGAGLSQEFGFMQGAFRVFLGDLSGLGFRIT